MKSILVVDDERDIVDLIRYNLAREGYRVLEAHTGTQALASAQEQPDLILLDIMMPEMDGLEVIRRLKRNERTSRIPVIFLTARGTDVDEVVGLELGADDYITKPISIPRLVARIRAALRREEEGEESSSPPITIGPVQIQPSQYVVRVEGKEVFFPRKEFGVLVHLARRLGHVVDRQALLDEVWGRDVYVLDRTVDVHISKIREKLGSHADLIETVKGVGYRMRESP